VALKNFKELLNRVNKKEKQHIAVAMAQDADILLAMDAARSAGLAEGILIGSKTEMEKIAKSHHLDLSPYTIMDVEDEKETVRLAVESVRSGEAQVIMKGLCSTSIFLKGLLDKQNGLRSGKVLSHLAVFESANYHKLLYMSDAAMNIAPDLNDKIAITQNAISALHSLGYKIPKVAMISLMDRWPWIMRFHPKQMKLKVWFLRLKAMRIYASCPISKPETCFTNYLLFWATLWWLV